MQSSTTGTCAIVWIKDLSVARHQKSNDSKKVGYYHWAVCAKCHAWTKAGSKQITMRDGFQYPFQSKKKGGKRDFDEDGVHARTA